MDVGERLTECLVAHDVRAVFGVPGGQTTPLYHGIATTDGIQHVLMRDERSAAFAADAYARIRGTVGVCDATVGPGATNLVSGLLEAQNSSIPIIGIVADIPRAWEHRRDRGSASQGCDQRSFLDPTVKWYGRVNLPEAIDDVVRHAVSVATSNRAGPTIIEIPDDVFAAEYPNSYVPVVGSEGGRFPRMRQAAEAASIEEAVDLISGSLRPLLLVGGGAQISGAHDEVEELVNLLRVPFVTTISGKGIVAETHPLAMGVIGAFGVPVANDLMQEADCIIAVGTKLNQAGTLGWKVPTQGTPVIHIDIDAEEIGRNVRPSFAVLADARLAVSQLCDAFDRSAASFSWNLADLRNRIETWWTGPIGYTHNQDEDAIKPQHVMRALANHFGGSDVVAADASLSSGWISSRWRMPSSGRKLIAPRGLAGLGWGLPAAIGAQVALQHLGSSGRAVCVAGDGGWGYSMAEVETAARLAMPVVSVILNNSTLSWNKHVISRRYPDGWVSQDLDSVNYSIAAQALGAVAFRVEDEVDLNEALREAFSVEDGPSVVEVVTSEIETPVLDSTSGSGSY